MLLLLLLLLLVAWFSLKLLVRIKLVVSLDKAGGLQNVLHVAPHLFLQRSSMGPLLPSGFSEEGAELYNLLWGLWSCLA